MSDNLAIFSADTFSSVSSSLKVMASNAETFSDQMNRSAGSLSGASDFSPTFQKALKDSIDSLPSLTEGMSQSFADAVDSSLDARSMSRATEEISRSLADLKTAEESLDLGNATEFVRGLSDATSGYGKTQKQALAYADALQASIENVAKTTEYASSTVVRGSQIELQNRIKAGSGIMETYRMQREASQDVKKAHDEAFENLVSLGKESELALKEVTAGLEANKTIVENLGGELEVLNDSFKRSSDELLNLTEAGQLENQTKEEYEKALSEASLGVATLTERKAKLLQKMDEERSNGIKLNSMREKASKLTMENAEAQDKLKKSMDGNVSSIKSYLAVQAVATLAVKSFASTQQATISALKSTSIGVEEMGRATTMMSGDMVASNLTVGEATEMYKALGEAQMLNLGPGDKLRAQTMQMGRALDMNAQSVVGMQVQLENVWGVGSKAIPGIGSAMVAAAKETMLTRSEVQGVVKSLTPLITTIPAGMRTQMVPAFLAVQAELKKSGGDASEFGAMIASTMDITSEKGQKLQALLGGGLSSEFANLNELMASGPDGMNQAMILMKGNMAELMGSSTDTEDMLKSIAELGGAYSSELGISVEQMRQLAQYSGENASEVSASVAEEMKRAGALKENYDTAQSGLNKAYARLQGAFLPLLHNIGEKLAIGLTLIMDAISYLGEKLKWLTTSDVAGWIGVVTLAIVAMSAKTLIASASFGKMGGAMSLLGKLNPFKKLMGSTTEMAKGITDAGSSISKSQSSTASSVSKSSKGMAHSIKSAFNSVFDVLKKGVDFLGSTLKTLSGSIKDVVVNLSSGIGKGVQSILTGVGVGLGAMGKGAMVGAPGLAVVSVVMLAFGAAVWMAEGAIKAIGDSMVGMFKELTKMSENSGGLIETGLGLTAIGVGLAAMGTSALLAIPGLTALAAVGLLMGDGGGIFSPIKKISEDAKQITTGEGDAVANMQAMQDFMDAFSGAVSALNGAIIKGSLGATLGGILTFFSGGVTAQAEASFVQLKDFTLAVESKSAEMKNVDVRVLTEKIASSVSLIQAVGDSGVALDKASEGIRGGAFSSVTDFFSGGITESISDTLDQIIQIASKVSSKSDMLAKFDGNDMVSFTVAMKSVGDLARGISETSDSLGGISGKYRNVANSVSMLTSDDNLSKLQKFASVNMSESIQGAESMKNYLETLKGVSLASQELHSLSDASKGNEEEISQVADKTISDVKKKAEKLHLDISSKQTALSQKEQTANITKLTAKVEDLVSLMQKNNVGNEELIDLLEDIKKKT